MNILKDPDNGMKYIVVAAALVIVIAGIYLAQSVVVLVLVSVFLALLGAPPVLWLKAKRVPSGIAVIIVMAAMITLLLLIGAQIGTSISGFSEELPFLQERIREQIAHLSLLLNNNGIAVHETFFLDYFNPEAVMKLTAGILTGLSSVLSDFVLILLTVLFILLEVSSFPLKLRAIFDDPQKAFPEFTKFVLDMKRYMVFKTLISLFTGVLIGLWLFILGVDYPILWGFLAFLFNFIPSLGSIIAALPAVLFAFIQFGMGDALLTMTGYLVVNFTVGNMIEPRLMGRKLGLSTLVVFLSLIFWGNLLGLVGAILCIPLTMAMKFAFENNKNTHWIAVLLGSEKVVEVVKPKMKYKK